MSTKTTDNEATIAEPTGCAGMEMPSPGKEHAWLQRFVGSWDAEVEASMGPDQPPAKMKGSNRVSMLGGFWMIEEGSSETMPFQFRLTLGYDPEKQKYVGTWTDTMLPYLWHYEGTVDSTGNKLTLETDGPVPGSPGVHTKFRETTEFKTDDHRVFTSKMQAPDGSWTPIMTVNLRRKS